MERTSFAILFYVRDSRIRKDGTAAIEVSLTVNGERSFFSTGKRVCVQNWDKSRQLVRGNSEEAKSINKFLSALKAKIYQKEAELLDRGFVITAELLRDAYFDKVESLKEHSLMSVLDEHNAQSRSMVGKTVAKSTYFNFEHGGKLLQEYIRSKYGRNDLYLRELNLDFIQGFHAFLLNEKNMQQNTTTKHLKFLKKLLNIAVSNSYISYNPVAAYKVEREPVEIDFLDEDELRRIINFDTPLPRLERARDMFLFGCFTGLSYIDIKTLTPEHFETDGAGRIWIKKRRVKTGVLSRIPLLPIAKMILDKYKGGDKLLPIQDALTAMSKVDTDLKIVEIADRRFPKQTPIPVKKIKEELQKIYDTLGISKRAKATDMEQWYDTNTMSRKIEGKTVSCMTIIRSRFIRSNF